MPSTRSHIRRAGRMSNLLAIALLTLPLPTQADGTNPNSRERAAQHQQG
jgi:hypothetical protein